MLLSIRAVGRARRTGGNAKAAIARLTLNNHASTNMHAVNREMSSMPPIHSPRQTPLHVSLKTSQQHVVASSRPSPGLPLSSSSLPSASLSSQTLSHIRLCPPSSLSRSFQSSSTNQTGMSSCSSSSMSGSTTRMPPTAAPTTSSPSSSTSNSSSFSSSSAHKPSSSSPSPRFPYRHPFGQQRALYSSSPHPAAAAVNPLQALPLTSPSPSAFNQHSTPSSSTHTPNPRVWPLASTQGMNPMHASQVAAAVVAAAQSQSNGGNGFDHHSAFDHHHSPAPQFSSLMQQQINEYARQPQQGVTLKQLVSVGPRPTKEALLQSARFLYKELPIRLAKRVRELESLPYGLSVMPPVLKVKQWYVDSFRELLSVPEPRTESDEESFTRLLDAIYNRHNEVVVTLAQGVVQMKKELGEAGNDIVNQCPFLQDFLNRFHSSRIGIRLLISQHVALHQPVDGYIGVIATNVSPIRVIHDAISDASRICDREYGYVPEVEVLGEDLPGRFNFIPNHLHHIIFELMKNSMRAVIEFHAPHRKYDLPPIQVVLTEDEREFAIKISDQGGGIPRQDMHRIWSYLYTTVKKDPKAMLDAVSGCGGAVTATPTPAVDLPSSDSSFSSSSGGVDAASGHPTNGVGPEGSEVQPMSGFGYGLPISRLYAQYFGGDLNVVSVQGFGTDAYLYLSKLGDTNLFLE